MKKILITGGSGFIGTNFVNYLAKKNKIILNIDKISNVSTPEKFKKIKNKKNYFFLRNNLKNPKLILKILKKFKPDVIVNFASESHVDRSINNPLYFIRNNINSSSNLFYAYYMYYKIKKIKLFNISTDEVFGSIPTGAFKETDSYNPSSPYSASKSSIDLIATAFNKTYKTEIKIINMVNNYGPYQFPEKLIPTIIFHFLKNKPAPIYGNGKNIREWIHVDDSCEAIWKSIISKKKFSRINIGSENCLSNLEIAKKIFFIMKSNKLTKLNFNNYIKKVNDRPGHDKRYALDSSLLKKIINYKQSKDLNAGLRETIFWYINNKKWYRAVNKSEMNYRKMLSFVNKHLNVVEILQTSHNTNKIDFNRRIISIRKYVKKKAL